LAGAGEQVDSGMTRLDRQDAYLLTFTAAITATESAGPDASLVWLDASAFYPTGGGQEHDTGTLDGVRVTDVEVLLLLPTRGTSLTNWLS
jgi:Ser-tRNA(Ala) deacylase AlaX